LGRIYLTYRWDWTGAKSEFERAVALDPNGTDGRLAYDDLLVLTTLLTGRFDVLTRHVSDELARNPLDIKTLAFLGGILQLYEGHLDDALAIQRRLLDLDPAYLGAHGATARTLLFMGKNAEALAEAGKEAEDQSRLQNLALVYWAMGRRSDADSALREFETKFAGVAGYDLGTVHAYRGEADAAFTWLGRGYEQRSAGMPFLKIDPLLRNLRSDARYKILLRKMNLPE
jgi:tetratricopeptide (TPR) repeat protein